MHMVISFRNIMVAAHIILLLLLLLLLVVILPTKAITNNSSNSISVSQSITDGKTLVSKGGGPFELGFFSSGDNPQSQRHYLGIWYKNYTPDAERMIVWVANRSKPINNTSGILTLNPAGNLVLTQNNESSLVWNTTSEKQAKNPVAELLDSGNLVIRNDGEEAEAAYLWQSFDYPCDTILPGMKLGWDLRTGLERRVTSSKRTEDDPTPGKFSLALVLNNYPEFYLMNGKSKYSRFGPWNGRQFSGLSYNTPNQTLYDLSYVSNNKDEMFYSFTVRFQKKRNASTYFEKKRGGPTLVNFVVTEGGFYVSVRYGNISDWMLYDYASPDEGQVCDMYGICGPYASCTSKDSIVCNCLRGFRPKSPTGWKLRHWSEGCVRNISLSCNNQNMDGFVKYLGLKLPDTTHTLLYENISSLEVCRTMCLNNCSCTAYTNSNISGAGSGCVMWFGNLIDIRQYPGSGYGQDLYIRMAMSPPPTPPTTPPPPPPHASDDHQDQPPHKRNKRHITIIVITAAASFGMLFFCTYMTYRVQRRKNADKSREEDNIERHLDDLDLPLFNLQTITSVTNNFSLDNKIGQGGFGPVYKGKLADEQEVAVKRLSSNSRQGITEFLTEVKLTAKLQHRNLVKLLGCCIGGQEKLLVYEYMANGSLDSFIFDEVKGKLLEWPQRFHIIFGIARGLAYLHQDSRLRIIHRDLKASNVLLDDKLNPKISDFGMARSFGGDQIEGNTNRVVGTYGYMAPEYASDGLFSIKSDAFSFGVLLLEIICGNKNRALCHGNQTLNLVGYAWALWKEENAQQLIDSKIKDSCVASEVLRCIHVSLLCVQQYPEDRPTMTSVVLMLGSEMELGEPKEPGFFPRRVVPSDEEGNLCSKLNEVCSNGQLTITS